MGSAQTLITYQRKSHPNVRAIRFKLPRKLPQASSFELRANTEASVIDAISNNFRPILARDRVGDRALCRHDASLFDIGISMPTSSGAMRSWPSSRV